MLGREVITSAILSPELLTVAAVGGVLLTSVAITNLITKFNIKGDAKLILLKNVIVLATYVGASIFVGDMLLSLLSDILVTFKLL